MTDDAAWPLAQPVCRTGYADDTAVDVRIPAFGAAAFKQEIRTQSSCPPHCN
jgi:hypothetical protein